MGVKDPFYAYVVFDAYRSKHINHAYNDCAWNLSGLKVSWEMERDVLPVDGRNLKIGGYSHVAGYSGH